MAQHRDRPRLTLTVSTEAAEALEAMASTFYGGNTSRAVDAAILAWAQVVASPTSHGLAARPLDALAAYAKGAGDA